MIKYFFLSLLMSFTAVLTQAQQDLFRSNQIVSPEINKDHTVTFRLMAPNAKEVGISGDWMPVRSFMRGSQAMIKTDSLWSYTTPALTSDLYTYTFTVDGVQCTDINNSFVVRDVANISNIFIISGGKGD